MLRCPHYVQQGGGRCGIWKHRNSVCSTWFCKHVRGAVGFDFWRELKLLLKELEEQLAIWCCLQIGLDARVIEYAREDEGQRSSFADELVKEYHDARHRRSWGGWAGKEAEFYERCSAAVAPLEWRDVRALGGQRLRAREVAVLDAYRHLVAPTIPARLRAAATPALRVTGNYVRITTYSPHDPIAMPETAWRALRRFDGRPVETVIAEMPTRARREFEDHGLLQKLVDYQILTPDCADVSPRRPNDSPL